MSVIPWLGLFVCVRGGCVREIPRPIKCSMNFQFTPSSCNPPFASLYPPPCFTHYSFLSLSLSRVSLSLSLPQRLEKRDHEERQRLRAIQEKEMERQWARLRDEREQHELAQAVSPGVGAALGAAFGGAGGGGKGGGGKGGAPPPSIGRGRGLSNLPAWMVEQKQAQAAMHADAPGQASGPGQPGSLTTMRALVVVAAARGLGEQRGQRRQRGRRGRRSGLCSGTRRACCS